MTIKLSAAIMAHPGRAAMVERLQGRLDREVPVVWDQKNNRWHTGRRSLLAYDPEASHHVVVQDDAWPALDLLAGLERWIPTLPNPETTILALYAGNIGRFRRVVQGASLRNPCWMRMAKIQWGVALVLPTSMIVPAVKYGDGRLDITNYDMKLSLWAQTQRLPVYYPYPSWVDHDPGPSLVKGHGENRKAWKALAPEQSVLSDWSRRSRIPVVEVPDFNRPGDGAKPLRRIATNTGMVVRPRVRR